jgi:uncharacterized repeat protein (TIGR01451 family)
MKHIFSLPMWRAGAFAALAIAAFLGSTAASAASPPPANNYTPSGTTISNMATVTFSVGGIAQPAVGSAPSGNTAGPGTATNFVVDNLVSQIVQTNETSPVPALPGQSAVTATFIVSNTGNNTQDYALTVNQLGSGSVTVYGSSVTDNYDATSCSIYVGASATPTTFIASLAPDQTANVKVVCSVPNTQVNGDLAAFSLTAEAKTAGSNGTGTLTALSGPQTAGVDIVFGDAQGSDDAPRDGKHSVRGAFKVVTATLNVTKTFVTVCDPFNGSTNPTNVPGGYVQYVVNIQNTGSVSAILTQVQDVLSTNVSFDPDLIKGTGAGTQCAAGVAPTSVAGSGIKVVQTNRGALFPANYPKYLTTNAADGDGGGYTAVTRTVAADFSQVLPPEGGYAAGELKQGETVQVIFQVKIN